MNIQKEKPEDRETIRAINLAAFKAPVEADLVDALRAVGLPAVSLVAHERGRLFGHILFTPVVLDPPAPEVRLAGLGPMAVIPEHQEEGLGSMLVAQGLNFCQGEGYHAVVVLGDPGFHARFGFNPASRYGLRCGWDVPEGAFMALELTEGSLSGHAGIVRYHPLFDAAV